MSAAPRFRPLNQFTEIGDLSVQIRDATKRIVAPLCLVLAVESAFLSFSGKPGASAFAFIAAGACIVLSVWSRKAIGLPLLPMLVVQNLIIYGVPIIAGHETILTYPSDFVFRAGLEVLIFDIAAVMAWMAGMRMFRPSSPSCYALHEFNRSGAKGWARLGFGMVIGATFVEVLQDPGVMGSVFNELPSGAASIISALLAVIGACGFFLVSMLIGGGEASVVGKIAFWFLLAANVMISAEDFILSTAAATLVTVAIGFFWSSGRVPWRYLAVVVILLSFLNTGKTAMRTRYWESEEASSTQVTIDKLPATFSEWAQASFHAIAENGSDMDPQMTQTEKKANKNQTLLDRIDNLQNLLFVIDAISTDHIKLLEGQTYALIPPLLVPRILWPDKPRSHEGQILLNVQFGRQDLASTFTTYIAWGLLPEAYGNFGPIAGSILLGVALGGLFAWIENLTARKLVISMEGFMSISLLMSLMGSFEMVASVFVTSTFQSFVAIAAASLPFVHRTANRRRTPIDT